MPLEQITVSLEWAKKLKEAGWTQEGLLWWCQWTNDESPPSQVWRLEYVATEDDFVTVTGGSWERCSAPTFEEITEKFRDEDGDIPNVQIRKKWYRLHMNWDFFSLLNIENDDDCLIQFPRDCRHDSMADLAAQVYCYLAENNLLPTPHDS